jgi:putative nucleotidyltransferase with HDIG domain
MQKKRPSHLALAAQVAALLAAIGIGILAAPAGNWDLSLMAVLFVFAAVSDVTAFAMPSRIKVSGNMVSLILAVVFLGGTPAAAIGAATILVGWFKWRDPSHYFLSNLLTFITFPLVGGIGFHAMVQTSGVTSTDAGFYLLVVATFFVALLLNFSMIAGYSCYVERDSFWRRVQTVLVPVLPSELTTALMCVAIVYIYDAVGVTAVALAAVTLLTFQHLLGQLLLSQQRAEELEDRTKQLVSFQVGMLSALMRTLDLRDEMTARHSASVARYCRAIAENGGLSKEDQELVHVAGLLHDIGKFILPDKILKANVPLDDDDWNLIKMHPAQGAKVVGSVDGYGPVAKIIMAHHERIDGNGYPRGLKGDEIPELSRIISVADTYDVMTARDSYRDPVSSFEAIQELQRVAGAQLDERFVKVFVEQVLEARTSASATARTPTSTSSWRSRSESPRWSREPASWSVLTRTAATGSIPIATFRLARSGFAPAYRPGLGNCVPTNRSHIRSVISLRAPRPIPADAVTL